MKDKSNVCHRCHGTGRVTLRIKNLGTREYEEQICGCPQLGCRNGVFDREIYYQSWDLPRDRIPQPTKQHDESIS